MSTAERDIKDTAGPKDSSAPVVRSTVTIELTVVEGLTVPRGTACIGTAALAALECEPGDLVEITGGRTTVAEVQPWSLDPEDADRQPGVGTSGAERTIAMDGLVRQNARASLGDTVTVRRVQAQPAISAALVPVAGPAALGEAELRHIARS